MIECLREKSIRQPCRQKWNWTCLSPLISIITSCNRDIVSLFTILWRKSRSRHGYSYWSETEISVGDELGTCMWLKFVEGTTINDGHIGFPIWLEMPGMKMLTGKRAECDHVLFIYTWFHHWNVSYLYFCMFAHCMRMRKRERET